MPYFGLADRPRRAEAYRDMVHSFPVTDFVLKNESLGSYCLPKLRTQAHGGDERYHTKEASLHRRYALLSFRRVNSMSDEGISRWNSATKQLSSASTNGGRPISFQPTGENMV